MKPNTGPAPGDNRVYVDGPGQGDYDWIATLNKKGGNVEGVVFSANNMEYTYNGTETTDSVTTSNYFDLLDCE